MAGENVGLSSLFHHIDLILASAHLLTDGPYRDDIVIQYDESGGNIGLTSGLIVLATRIPEFWGHKIGFHGLLFGSDVTDDEYNPAWGELVNWTLLMSGTRIASSRQFLTHGIEYVLWDEALPQAVTIHGEPGWEYDVFTLHL